MNFARIKAFRKSARTSGEISTMLSSLQNSISYILMEELRRTKHRYRRLKILLYEEYLPLFYMTLYQLFVGSTFLTWVILMYINFKLAVFLFIGYYSWTLYDSRTLNTEGRRSYWLRSLPIFNFIRDYFPIRLIKTAELPAGKPYILAMFPHGVYPFGAMYNFGTNINKFPELFPGHDIRGAVFNFLLYVPIFREFLMAAGSCTCNEENIKYLLESNPPKTVGLCPGGIKEMLASHAGSEYKIVKENRKGFVRIALQTGSTLVPVFTFGEQNSMDHIEVTNPLVRAFMDLLHKIMRGRLPFIAGRGIFQEKFGVLPFRRPITSVVGKPIPVPKVENPSPALIDEYHERFHQALRNLFEENKRMYDEFGEDATLKTI